MKSVERLHHHVTTITFASGDLNRMIPSLHPDDCRKSLFYFQGARGNLRVVVPVWYRPLREIASQRCSCRRESCSMILVSSHGAPQEPRCKMPTSRMDFLVLPHGDSKPAHADITRAKSRASLYHGRLRIMTLDPVD